jgi:hypothetical protein
MNMYIDSVNGPSKRTMISFGYDQIMYHEDKCLTYQGTYMDAYFTQLYRSNIEVYIPLERNNISHLILGLVAIKQNY